MRMIKRLSIAVRAWVLVVSPAIVRAAHHPRPGATQSTNGSGQSLLFILAIIALVGIVGWLMRKKKRKKR